MQFALSVVALAAVASAHLDLDYNPFANGLPTAWPTEAPVWSAWATKCPETATSSAASVWSSWAYSASYSGPCPFEATSTTWSSATPTAYTSWAPVYSSSVPAYTTLSSTWVPVYTSKPTVAPVWSSSSSSSVVAPVYSSSSAYVAPPPPVYTSKTSVAPVWSSTPVPVYTPTPTVSKPATFTGAAATNAAGMLAVVAAAGVAALL